jgi:hypothetical protein
MISIKPEIDPKRFVESSTPQSEQRHRGWYWDYKTKKFYRWDNIPKEK